MLRMMGMGLAGAYLAGCAPAAAPAPTTVPPTAAAAAPAAPTTAPAGTAAATAAPGLQPSDFTSANIDWKRFKGLSLGVAMLQSPPATDFWKEAIKLFESLSGATVAITELHQNELADRRFADLVSKAGTFDVVNTEFDLLPGYAQAKLIEPLNKYIDDPNLTDKKWLALEDFYEGILNSGKVGTEQYALPMTAESTLLSYRKDLISKKPDTFDDLMEMAKNANKPGDIAGFVARGQRGAGMNVYIWAGFLHGFGGDFFVKFPDDMHPAINSPEAIAAAEFYATILQNYGPAGVANYTNEEPQLDAENGKAASLIEWSGNPILIDNPANSKTSGKWAYAQVPKGPGGRWPAVFSWTFAVNGASKQKEAAWALAQFIASPPAQLNSSKGLIIPTRKSIADDPGYQAATRTQIIGYDSWAPESAEALKTANPEYRPRFADWPQVGDRVGIALQSVIAKEQSAKEAFDKAQADIETLMKDKKYI